MKKLVVIAIAFLTLSAFTTIGNTWKSDPPHTQLGFTVTHLGINDISGAFEDVSITLNAKGEDLRDAAFSLVAQTVSVDTRVDARNNHLKSTDFFNAEKYPEMSFTSTEIKKEGNNRYSLTGELSLHGITKTVHLNVLDRGLVTNPMSNKETRGIQVSGTIKRSDFGIGEKFPEAVISDEVRIIANAEFLQDEN
ncbi:Polyisoprenoid-binding protein YceI [Sinomicrobium oceani]|uniref:Polyisoprenoid-binding protein YceI n=1 Tax=Sinomicrobium oceani TaxID=1150368 RepID=A0A1K1RV43_9FLAO|nr:YceI family protein [Sinomicrobium oceani]SFW76024.1 Polyisoprenoid-binding protein YceI [Sinomicrobium oceani]